MSKLVPTIVTCPRCEATQRARVFESLHADHIPAQLELVIAGTFELVDCAQCGHAYRPEHTMLFAHFSAHTWIVMHPRWDRPSFTTLERGVELVMDEHFGEAPSVVAAGVRGLRPRLVFGQHMLTEAVRCARAGLDPALLECAKLLAVRRDMQRFMSLGPCELCFERIADSGELVHSVHALTSGETLATWSLPGDAIDEVRAGHAELEQLYPELFHRPYVSACRYLYGATT